MKKILIAAGFIAGIGTSAFAQNYISGIVSLYGNNTASGTTTVGSGASLIFNNSKLYAQRSFVNRGDSTAISADSGTLVLSGKNAQAITGRFRISALQINNNGTDARIVNNVSPTMVTILDSVTFGDINNSSFDAGDSLMTLRSTVLKTARVADLTHNEANTGNAITGRVIAERYLRSRRAWRLLSPPTTADSANDQTISEAWQEGARAAYGQIVNPNPGYGTEVTRPGYNPPVSTTGYDDGLINSTGYGLRSYLSNGLLTQPDNTDFTHFSAHAAYFLFVRGDRSVPPELQTSTYHTAPSITTLRSRGALHNGTVIDTVTNTMGTYAGVGNPYACTVDFDKVELNNVTKGFYTWDPSINTIGAWVYIDGTDNYNAVPTTPFGVGIYTNPATNSLIQSGQAITVKPTAALGTLTFKEMAKNTTSRSDAFRLTPLPALVVSLYAEDSISIFADGATTVFDPSFSKDALPDEDITKPTNLNENLSFYAPGNYLMKNKWPMPLPNDTLPLELWRTTTQKYRFEINETRMDGAPQAYLLDKYLKTSDALKPNANTTHEFEITSDKDSKSIDRFAIVFGSSILPVTLLDVKAELENDGVNVQWNVRNEVNIKSYEIERSTEGGTTFIAIGAVASQAGNVAAKSYQYLDAQPASGDNFYRIKSIEADGSFTYSSIVKVTVPVGVSIVSVYPNPVKNEVVNVWFANKPAGFYSLVLYSADGKIILNKKVEHAGGNANYQLHPGMLAQGLYHLVVTSKDGHVKSIDIPVIFQ